MPRNGSAGVTPVTDEEYPEYQEPTNKQLAEFMVVISTRLIGEHNLQLDAGMIERLITSDFRYKSTALKHHRRFHDEAKEMHAKMLKGKLRCAHIRDNGKRCVNFNQPGSYFCGLHKDLYEEDAEAAAGGE
jgi:hypothetical protein